MKKRALKHRLDKVSGGSGATNETHINFRGDISGDLSVRDNHTRIREHKEKNRMTTEIENTSVSILSGG